MVANVKLSVSKKSSVVNILRGVKSLGSAQVLVGFPKDGRQHRKDGPLNNATIAKIHNEGASGAGKNRNIRIPQRQFMQPGIISVEKDIAKFIVKAGLESMNGHIAAAYMYYSRAGLKAQSGIRNYINDGKVRPPLAPRTLQMRKAKGIKGEKPLMATKQLRVGVTYRIVGIERA